MASRMSSRVSSRVLPAATQPGRSGTCALKPVFVGSKRIAYRMAIPSGYADPTISPEHRPNRPPIGELVGPAGEVHDLTGRVESQPPVEGGGEVAGGDGVGIR